ncbi:unnamed protein product [Adineta steineri]|uniref:F-box domain-containing protein n=1 Tax=Adineta steineri TaxID=433720 RepID=A0A815SQE4_9BILA|nr:unnamed protein product [Adineta steineri]CAF1493370.1 unnamed protein product [Adineta steineri]
MSSKTILSLHTLPVEMVYRILDNLNPSTIFWSMETVCQRLNAILDSYDRYKAFDTLKLRSSRISDVQLQHIANALQYNKTIAKLDLSRNKIGDTEVKYIANALRHNRTLRSLDLIEAGISDEGAHSLAIALKHNTTLTKLGLRCNNIQDQGALHLVNALQQNRTLDGFTFESSKRPTAMAWHLENAKRRIIAGRKLGLEWCHLRDADAQLLANALQENTTLISLSLRDNNIGDKGAKYLGEALRNNRVR